jgi:hypothetical protein
VIGLKKEGDAAGTVDGNRVVPTVGNGTGTIVVGDAVFVGIGGFDICDADGSVFLDGIVVFVDIGGFDIGDADGSVLDIVGDEVGRRLGQKNIRRTIIFPRLFFFVPL